MPLIDRYRGNGWVGSWVVPALGAAGTVALNGEQSSFEWSTEIDLVEVTAGSAQFKEFLAGVKNGTAKLKVFETVTGTTGSAFAKACIEGYTGTLIWGPLGNAAGRPQYLVAALVKTVSVTYPFEDAVTREIEWQFTATPSRWEVGGTTY